MLQNELTWYDSYHLVYTWNNSVLNLIFRYCVVWNCVVPFRFLRTFAQKIPNIDFFFLKMLSLKNDDLVMSEMEKKNGRSPTWREHARKNT